MSNKVANARSELERANKDVELTEKILAGYTGQYAAEDDALARESFHERMEQERAARERAAEEPPAPEPAPQEPPAPEPAPESHAEKQMEPKGPDGTEPHVAAPEPHIPDGPPIPDRG